MYVCGGACACARTGVVQAKEGIVRGLQMIEAVDDAVLWVQAGAFSVHWSKKLV